MPRLLCAAAIAALGFLSVAALRWTGALERLELLTLDARYRLGIGRKPAGNDVVVAWIDQESMDHLDDSGVPFPWPREVYAQVLEHLLAAGARAVAFDLLFDQRGFAEDDRAFGETLAAARGDVLAMKFVEHRRSGRDEGETRAFAERGLAAPAEHISRGRERGIVLPIEELAGGADHLAFVNIRPDADKVYRHYDLLRLWGPPDEGARAYPSLALAAALAAAPRGAGGFELGAEGLSLPGAPPVAVGRDGRALLNFRGGPFTFAPVKLVNILESINRLDAGEEPLYAPDRFQDKIVLVGIHAEGYEDAHPTPLSERFPGVELHATALDNLLRGDALRELGLELPLAALAAVAGSATVFALPGVLLPLVALGLSLALGLAGTLWAWTALVVVPVAAPVLAGGTAAGGAFLYRLLVEGKEKRHLQRAFRSYLAPDVLREVLRDPGALRLGGEVREVTLFFTDLEGFTGLSERSRPDELVAFLNDYFTRMCAPLLAEHGVIDKFTGDAIMAFFGAPIATQGHGLAAVRAALRALETSEAIAGELVARGLPPIRTRIGIHSGPAVVGNMGSSERFDYTAIGDTVNLASRLEGANKALGTRCLASETAWQAAGAEVLGRALGPIAVVGRAAPIRVWEPLALAARATEAQRAWASAWESIVGALAAGERETARAALRSAGALQPGDRPTALYLARLADPTFDGTLRLDLK